MSGRPAVTAEAPDPAPRERPGTDGPRAGRPALLHSGASLLPYVLLPAALLLWILSLHRVNLAAMADLGLLQVLPVIYWLAVLLLSAGFWLAVRDKRVGSGWLTAYVLGLIATIHATPTLLYPTLRYSWAWKHIAVLDAMIHHNGPVPGAAGFDIYNQWPGFFAFNGLLLRVTGLHSAVGYAAWWPPLVNALLLGPLLLLYRSVTTDRTLVWGAVWIYYCSSWVGQDYFAPQAFAFLLFVVVLAMVVRQLPGRAPPAGADPGGAHPLRGSEPPPGRLPPGGWMPVRFGLVLVVEAAIIASHQLTPIMLICALAALSVPRRNRRTVVPVLVSAVAMTTLWDATVAHRYLSANLPNFVRALTTPDGNISSGLAGLGAAAPGQVVVAWVDRGLSAGVFVLALAALWRRPWIRHCGLPLAAFAPLPLLAANSYGGEMIFRVYLFALPSLAFLIAALVLQPGRRPGLRAVSASLVALSLLGGLYFGYYSKEDMNYFTPHEVTAAKVMIELAPPGSLVVALTGNVPGGAADFDQHDRVQLDQGPEGTKELLVRDPLAGLEKSLAYAAPGTPAYLILNRAQAAECLLTGVMPADTVDRLGSAMDGSAMFSVVYRNDDAVVYRFVPVPASEAP